MDSDKPTGYRPPPEIIPPSGYHTSTLILLHGLGSTGSLFKQQFLTNGHSSFGPLPIALPNTKLVFPSAMMKTASLIQRPLSMWFDTVSLKDPEARKELQQEGLREEGEYLRHLIEEEAHTVSFENIAILGLSQGAAMASWVVLSMEERLGAFVGMSGWLPFRSDLESKARAEGMSEEDVPPQEREAAQKKALSFLRGIMGVGSPEFSEVPLNSLSTPVFIGHGFLDHKVKILLGEGLRDTLEDMGMSVEWHRYDDLGHWYKIPDEIDDFLEFFEREAGFVVDRSSSAWRAKEKIEREEDGQRVEEDDNRRKVGERGCRCVICRTIVRLRERFS